MTDKTTEQQQRASNAQKHRRDWLTGDEPMTGAQPSYLKTLCEEAKQDFDETLTKAQASVRIKQLQRATVRGRPASVGDASDQRGEQRAAAAG